MHCGCIAVSKIQCDGCHRFLKYGERYLSINGEEGKKQRLCIECCLSHGYASFGTEKGEQELTFFPKA